MINAIKIIFLVISTSIGLTVNFLWLSSIW